MDLTGPKEKTVKEIVRDRNTILYLLRNITEEECQIVRIYSVYS